MQTVALIREVYLLLVFKDPFSWGRSLRIYLKLGLKKWWPVALLGQVGRLQVMTVTFWALT